MSQVKPPGPGLFHLDVCRPAAAKKLRRAADADAVDQRPHPPHRHATPAGPAENPPVGRLREHGVDRRETGRRERSRERIARLALRPGEGIVAEVVSRERHAVAESAACLIADEHPATEKEPEIGTAAEQPAVIRFRRVEKLPQLRHCPCLRRSPPDLDLHDAAWRVFDHAGVIGPPPEREQNRPFAPGRRALDDLRPGAEMPVEVVGRDEASTRCHLRDVAGVGRRDATLREIERREVGKRFRCLHVSTTPLQNDFASGRCIHPRARP